MSQQDLGKTLGVSFQQVQKYERGANRVSASTLQEIGRALKTPPGDFFCGLPLVTASQEMSEGAATVNAFLTMSDGVEFAELLPLAPEAVRRELLAILRAIVDR